MLIIVVVVVIIYSTIDISRAYLHRPSVGILLRKFELDKLDDKYYRRFIRFIKEEIKILIFAFNIDEISYRIRYKSTLKIVLCLLLIYLSYL